MKVADFKSELSKVTGRNWMPAASDPNVELLYYQNKKYSFRNKSNSNYEYTIDVFLNDNQISKYRFDQ